MRLAPRGAAVAQTTILGFGSLLSEQSSRLTFPDLENFRLVRVPDYRRLMQHPASIFFQRGIADPQKKNWCSLSAEPCPGASFVACAFEVAFEMRDALRKVESRAAGAADVASGPMWKQIQEGTRSRTGPQG